MILRICNSHVSNSRIACDTFYTSFLQRGIILVGGEWGCVDHIHLINNSVDLIQVVTLGLGLGL